MKRMIWPLVGCLVAPFVQAAGDQVQMRTQVDTDYTLSEFTGSRSHTLYLPQQSGADLVWRERNTSGGVYIGPRVGTSHMADHDVDDATLSSALGVEAGYLQSLAPLDPQLKTLQFGLYFRQIYSNLHNQRSISAGSVGQDVDGDGQSELGLQFLWQPE